jgi:N utilization substance protein A
METFVSNTELILIADAVAREKNIPKESVLSALEDAIRVAARRKYGHEHSIRAEVDRSTGEVRIFREMMVIDPDAPVVENIIENIDADEDSTSVYKQEMNTISLHDARLKRPNAQIGDIISDPLPPIDLGRVAAQSAKQVITHRVKEIERNKNYDEFKDKIGQIVSGVIEKVEYGNAIVKLGSTEAMIRRDFQIKNERLRQGDRVRAYVYEVNKDFKGPQILLSRTHNEFLAALFAQEVPEIYDGIIEIRAVSRDPGARAKIAVFSSDTSIDPIGSCVGMRGARVQAVINELAGEKIDIIEWSSEPATMVVNALSPATATKVIIDEDRHRIEVVVPDEQLSIAIGRRGQNVRLASKLVGWEIDVLTEEAESKRRSEEFKAVTEKFMSALDVEEILAQLLASEGYASIKDIAEASTADIASIEGLDEGIASELINRAREYSNTHNDAAISPTIQSAVAADKIDPRLKSLNGMSDALAALLYTSGVRTLGDLADLSRDEFYEKVAHSGLKDDQVDEVIMAAREIVYFKK